MTQLISRNKKAIMQTSKQKVVNKHRYSVKRAVS